MKLIALLLVILVFSFVKVDAEDAPKRGILLRRPNPKTEKPSTTAAPEEEEIVDEEYDSREQPAEEEENAFISSTTTTTTEAPKKIGPIIRPFRSNDDFLTSLKRRQMNAKKTGSKQEKPTHKPIKSASEGEESNDFQDSNAPVSGGPISPPAVSKYKGNAALNRRKLSRPSKHEHENEDGDSVAEEAAPVVKRPGRFSLKARN